MSASTSAAGRAISIIRPRPTSGAINRLRRHTTRAASSIVSAPPIAAAATSPKLWPISRSGRTPHASHCAARATSIAHSVGCTTSKRSDTGASGRS